MGEGHRYLLEPGCGQPGLIPAAGERPGNAPIYPGKRYEDWQLQDPAGQPIEIVRGIRDQIDGRVQQLLGELVPATN